MDHILFSHQPYLVFSTSKYMKRMMGIYGISHFYSFTADHDANRILSLPDGAIDILFWSDPERENFGADMEGTFLKPTIISFKNGYHYFGVRFLPGFMPKMVKDVAFHEIVGETISSEKIGIPEVVIQNIGRCKDFVSQVRLFLEIYETESTIDTNKQSIINYAIDEITMSNGNRRIKELSEKIGYSKNYVNNVFKQELGIKIKDFCEIVRFQRTLEEMHKWKQKNERLDMTDLATEMGYYDQSHMIMEFKKLSDRTPGTYMQELAENNFKDRLFLF